MLSGDNGILQKSTEAKRTTERAEAKEQAQMDIMSYIADKTANHQDASLNDAKIQEILSDNKSYVKTANATSFITAKGEYEIFYSELYNATVIQQKNLFEFTVLMKDSSEKTYTAEVGMTWESWLQNSSYNTDNFTIMNHPAFGGLINDNRICFASG